MKEPLLTIALVEMQDAWLHELCALFASNDEYLRHMHETADASRIREMLCSLPPGARVGNKYNLVHRARDRLIGFVEVIMDYPEPNAATIGLMMVSGDLQGRGAGARLFDAVLARLRPLGTQSLFLSYADTNVAAGRFWRKCLFVPNGDVEIYDDLELIAMERAI